MSKLEITAANDRQVGGDHYRTGGDQHWDLFGLDYLIGYATKYMRWRKKGGVQDLEKAIHVIEKIKEVGSSTIEGRAMWHHWPRYDRERMLRWARNAGLDWTETQIMVHIMFSNSPAGQDEAIAGIRHLIAMHQPSAKHGGGTISEMSEDKLVAERERLENDNAKATGWGAAVGARSEAIDDINRELARRNPAPRTPEAGSHHASLSPWCMADELYRQTFAGVLEHAEPFYRRMGLNGHVLEPYVENHGLPVALRPCYNIVQMPNGRNQWLIRIDRVPPDLRDQYPRLRMELNMKEWEESPEWQRILYKWIEIDGKYRLQDTHLGWGPEL